MNLIEAIDRFSPDPALREWVLSHMGKLAEQTKRDAQTIAANENAIKAADLKIQALTLELAYYKRIRFANKSEQFSPEQCELFQESWNTDSSAIAAEVEDLADKQSGKKSRPRAGRQPLPDHLPRIEHRHEPESCQCGECGNALVKIGEDVSEQLDVEPARFFVHRHIRPQYACRQCETVKAEPVPPAIIDGGMAAPGLLTWVMISKFADHLPLYRLEQIAARQNVVLSRSTLADWVGRVGFALQPLVDRLTELLLKRAVLHADETPVAQLDPGVGKTKKAYLWSYRSNDLDEGAPIVVFDYQPGRSGSHARNFLQDWTGRLMVDDYAGYKALFGKGIVELACWAHARRKFFDLHAANQSPIAAEALADCQIVCCGTGRQRHERRRATAITHGMGRAAAERHALLADRHPKNRGGRQRYCPCDRLQPEAMGRLDSLRGFRPFADRQQSGGKQHPPDRGREKELAVRRQRAGRPSRRRHPDPARHSQAQRPRSSCMAEGHLGKTSGLAKQPHRRTAAITEKRLKATWVRCTLTIHHPQNTLNPHISWVPRNSVFSAGG